MKAMRATRPGSFFMVRGYSSETSPGEVADYWCQFGVNYRNILNKDLDTLTELATRDREGSYRVEHGAWVDPKGFEGLMPSPTTLVSPIQTPNSVYGTLSRTERLNGFNSSITTEGYIRTGALKSRESKDRVYVRVSYVIGSNHPLAERAIDSMLASLQRRLEAYDRRERAKRVYKRECRGGYTLLSSRGSLYIRQALVVWKKEKETSFPSGPVASSPLVAIKEAVEIQEKLRTGRIRSFIVSRDEDASDRFDSISVGGTIVVPDPDGKFRVPVPAEAEQR